MPTPTRSRSPFLRAFYVANTMEIFERLAWYGFFSLSSLYMTSPASQGGLGFSDQDRGFLQGMIPFLLYLLPVITGALADRYGYRRMFLLAFAIMCPAYYLLGQVHAFWPFCAIFLLLACGAACFKPVVVGTIGRSTDDSNRGLGFGVFYMMVNVGGFLGPLVAGYVRAVSWDWVFVMSSIWIAVNFIPALFFYKEPQAQHGGPADQRSLSQVLQDTQEVLGNGRLALMVVPGIIGLMVAAKGGISYATLLYGMAALIMINIIWSALLKQNDASYWYQPRPWFRQPVRVGNRQFVTYLLIMAGFWTIYMQVFITLPLYIRDFVDTGDMVQLLRAHAPSLLNFLADVNSTQLAQALPALAQKIHAGIDAEQLRQIGFELANYKVLVPPDAIREGFGALQHGQLSAAQLAQSWAADYRQINPEYIVDLDFAAIVLLQIVISSLAERWKALPVLVAGTLVLSAGIGLCGLGHGVTLGGFSVAAAVVLFALGEMIASPKSQEYVAAIAPKNKTAMFMGYYFVSMAIGNLLGGLLSGWAYGTIARDSNRPLLMWALFAAIGVLTALALLLFNRQRAMSLDGGPAATNGALCGHGLAHCEECSSVAG